MSSARSVASARAKRAGTNETIKPTYPTYPPVQTPTSTIPAQNAGDKLSISHAITLITLRLSKIETYIQNLETETLPLMLNSPQVENTNNISYQPLEEKINLLMNKLDSLEKENTLLHNKIQILELQANQSIEKKEIVIEPQVIQSFDKEEILNELKEHILPFESEITKLKDLLLYLQHNSLEINQKLIHVLFNNLNVEDIEDIEDIENEENEENIKKDVEEEIQVVIEENEITEENKIAE
jgi:hypothetical protein